MEIRNGEAVIRCTTCNAYGGKWVFETPDEPWKVWEKCVTCEGLKYLPANQGEVIQTGSVVPLFGYGTYEFYWGTAIKEERTKEWVSLLIVHKQEIREIDVRGMGVIVHENGIEFVHTTFL